jgi:hypothetical protein
VGCDVLLIIIERYYGYPILAGTIGCSTILGLAVIFVLGKKPSLMKQDEDKEVK